MQSSIGEIVRQIRRLRHLTQRELAGDRYSKSYVCAVEQNRIAPSPEALRFFAQQLGQSDGNFVALLQQPDIEQALSVLETLLPATNGQNKQDAALLLLHTLLDQATSPGFLPSQMLPVLAPATLASLPPHLQARYYLLMGRGARAQRDVASALHALEAALALASADQQAAILDEIGLCYYQQHAYHTALGYHLHALHLLSKASSGSSTTRLSVALHLHCGDDYRAVGAYPQALEHFEAALTSLSAQNDLATAGQVYAGLGSLLYASLSLVTASFTFLALSHAHTPEQIEREFERASSFLQQGVGFYQAYGDRLRETWARLTLASLQLDWATWRRRRMMPNRTDMHGKKPAQGLPTTVLDHAAEHCRQVLLAWQKPILDEDVPPSEVDALLSTALAALIRIAVQRATCARLDGDSVDGAYRERAFAVHLCQLVLDTHSTRAPLRDAASQSLMLSAERLEYRSPTLPPFTDMPDLLTTQGDTPPRNLLGPAEVYAAVGEVAEELGRVAATSAYAHDWYTQANQYQQAALSLAHRLHTSGERDPASLARLYQRWIALLQERATATPDLSEETVRALLHVLQQGIWHLQQPSAQETSVPGGGALS